jgi:hypothetical protein
MLSTNFGTFNFLKPNCYVMHQRVWHSKIVRSAHTVFTRMCFVFVGNKQRLVSLVHKLVGFYNRDEKCLQRGTDWVFK